MPGEIPELLFQLAKQVHLIVARAKNNSRAVRSDRERTEKCRSYARNFRGPWESYRIGEAFSREPGALPV